MSKMYKLEDGVILRDGEGIASYENGEVDFFSGMAKYRMPVTKWLKKAKVADKEVVKAPKVVKTAPKAVETVEKSWLEYLSAIVGVAIPVPHNTNGWRRTKYRELLLKNYDRIVKSDALTNEEKKAIINKFM